MFSNDDILYLAGFLDGEGCFSISHNGSGNVHTLSVEQTDQRVLEWCAATFGGTVRSKVRRAESRECTFEWFLRRKEPLIRLLRALVPHLKVKLVPASILLEYCLRFNRGVPSRVPYTEEDHEVAAQYIALMRIANSTGRGSSTKKDDLRASITAIGGVRVAVEKPNA